MRFSINILLCWTFFLQASSGQSFFEQINLTNDTTAHSNRLDLSGTLKSSLYGPGEIFDYNGLMMEFTMTTKFSLNDLSFLAESRFQKGWIYQKPHEKFLMRQMYGAFHNGKFTLKIGNMIINWGTGDGYNPTNNLTPVDYFWQSSIQDDQKIANLLMFAKYNLTDQFHLECIVIPIFKSSNYPYELIRQDVNTTFLEFVDNTQDWKDGATAFKIKGDFDSFSFSTSIFNGLDPFTSLSIKNIEWTQLTPNINFQIIPYRKTTLGFDFETIIGLNILRGELAYNKTKDFELSGHIPNPDLKYVLNFERTILNWQVILQYIGQFTLDHDKIVNPEIKDPNDPIKMMEYYNALIKCETAVFNQKIFGQQTRFNNAFSLSLMRSFNFETLWCQFNAYYNFNTGEYLFKPIISWKPTGMLNLKLGLNYMHGEEGEIFDMISPYMNNLFFEFIIRY